MRLSSRSLRTVVTVSLSAAALTAVTGTTPAHAGTCKHVKSTVSDIGVYSANQGGVLYGHFITSETFYAYAQERSRYKVNFYDRNGIVREGWVTTDTTYIANSTGCYDSSPLYY